MARQDQAELVIYVDFHGLLDAALISQMHPFLAAGVHPCFEQATVQTTEQNCGRIEGQLMHERGT